MIIKRIPTKLIVKEFLIHFEYVTWKSHTRKFDHRKIKHFDSESAKKAFNEWYKKQRTISNATILDIVEINENEQEIVL